MSSVRDRAIKSKKERKLIKLIENSESDDDSEHELSHYLNDRVKLMKQVLKIIKPKRIKSMAPDCMKNLDIAEINSMLLEELLGISNKRVKYIFTGQNVDEDSSSSTDPEDEAKPIDIISLDDVTDDDFVIEIDSSNEESTKNKKRKRVKKEPLEKKIKKEKNCKPQNKDSVVTKEKTEEENLMSVLELLELQARARAIRSQLALEANKRTQAQMQTQVEPKAHQVNQLDNDDEDAVIIEAPSFNEIVITSSDSENDESQADKTNEKKKHLLEKPSSTDNMSKIVMKVSSESNHIIANENKSNDRDHIDKNTELQISVESMELEKTNEENAKSTRSNPSPLSVKADAIKCDNSFSKINLCSSSTEKSKRSIQCASSNISDKTDSVEGVLSETNVIDSVENNDLDTDENINKTNENANRSYNYLKREDSPEKLSHHEGLIINIDDEDIQAINSE